MEKISNERFQDVKRKIELGQVLEDNELILENIINKGKKYVRAFEEILKDGEIDEKQLLEYSNKISALFEKIGFAPTFLVKELPIECVDSFEISKWQAITKASQFNKLDYESKKGCLMLCGVYGVFENDEDANHRTEIFISMLQNKTQNIPKKTPRNNEDLTPEQLERIQKKAKKREERIAQILTPEILKTFSGFKMNYDPQFYNFWLNIENRKGLTQEQLTEIQNNWDKIRKNVEVKTLDNILKYLEVSKQNTNSFDVYMQANNIPKHLQEKYSILYEQMSGRTKNSIPSCAGKNKNGYSYEILNFNDPRILRFGEKNLIKCCQKSGGKGESSMIFSAIESSARVIMIRNESGEYIAGSLITHQIGKDGRSHVCFDSIEVSANNANIKAESYQVTLKKIQKLVEHGIIQNGNLEELKEYYRNNPTKEKNRKFLYKLLEKADLGITRKIKALIDSRDKEITNKDLKALETNKKILDVYLQASEEMIGKDEEKRKIQLSQGKISEEEYSHLLMKNGFFTIGKNPVSMYLGSLDKLENKSMEQLPALQKDRSIYRKASLKGSLSNILENVALGSLYFMAGSYVVATILTFLLKGGMPIDQFSFNGLFTGAATLANIYFKRKVRQGVFSDARIEQRILKGKPEEKEEIEITENNIIEKIRLLKERKDFQKGLQNNLLYDEFPVISNPVKISELNPKEQKKLRRLSEVSLYNRTIDFSDEKLIIGNLENWAAVFSNKSEEFVLEDILLQNPLILSRNDKKLTDAQNDLLSYISKLAQSRKVIFNCKDKSINRYLSKTIKSSNSAIREQSLQPRFVR